ncbi:Crp/Fnr family transcriptional regulator [soil metagenome]
MRNRRYSIPKNILRSEIRNGLLASLPQNELDLLQPWLEPFEFEFESILYEVGKPIEHFYFPCSGVVSLLAKVNGNSTIEVGLIGNEGMAGVSAFLGAPLSPSRAIIQGTGDALRITTGDLERFGGSLKRPLLFYAHYLMVQISQSAACYRFHPIEQRLARWLLMTGDRMESNEYGITQDFLSNMLGVRREGVNRAAGVLQKKNLISFSRRNIITIDRSGLEATACECYQRIRDEEKSLR